MRKPAKPTKRTLGGTPAPPERPAGADTIDPKDSEDESGTYAEPGSTADTGESDTGVTEPAPHFRVPPRKKKRRKPL